MKKVRDLISNLSLEQLTNESYIENNLLLKLGLNSENLNEQPVELSEHYGSGLGLRIWQYPNQFSKYLVFLSQYAAKINSYMEIGSRYGGTFVTHCEYLRCFNESFSKSVAVDLIEIPPLLKEYCSFNKNSFFKQSDSTSEEFSQYLNGEFFDLVFIDGDHSYEGVLSDSEKTRNISNIQVFHDITSDPCPGVAEYWRKIKEECSETYNFYEFTDQYDSVDGTFLGIGVAVRKNWLTV